MRQHARRARTWAATLGLLAVFAAAAPAQSPEEPAFAGASVVRLGDDIQAICGGFPGEVHQYYFFASKGTRLSVRFRADVGGSLLADLRLAYAGGEELAVGERVSRGDVRRLELSNFEFPVSGYFVLEVVRNSGSGGYQLDTKARRQKRIRGLHPDPGSRGTWHFAAPGNSVVDIKVRAPGRHAGRGGPVIVGLRGPDGAAVRVVPESDGRSATAEDVLLVQDGTYELDWANPGGARRLRFSFALARFGGDPQQLLFGRAASTSPTAPQLERPPGDPREGYAGSATCGKCHSEEYVRWSTSAHNLAFREWHRGGLSGLGVVNDVDGNGRDDFQDGLDLGTTPAFEEYGENAPRLSYVAGAEPPYRVTVGAVTYTVDHSLGGNGFDQQGYVTTVGEARFPLPFQYDETSGTYERFEAEYWYDGVDPIHAAAEAIPAAASYEARCAGCHGSGLTVTLSGEDLVAGAVEQSVGCEQCHGPGAQHASTGNKAFIVNPDGFRDGSAAGVAALNAVCERCHDRGHAVDPIPGTSIVPAYGYNAEKGVMQFGDDPAEFRVPTEDPDDFFGYEGNAVPEADGIAFLAARRRYMQGIELRHGAHRVRSAASPACIDCHTAHGQRSEHMLRRYIDRGLRLAVVLPDNTFCLACHAGTAPFAEISLSDVDAISKGFTPTTVSGSVVAHMRDIGMGLQSYAQAAYDPTGTGVGRCDTCHMPQIGGEAGHVEDQAGFAVGDQRGHRFQIVWPNASEQYGVTNSCNSSGCHPTRAGDPAQLRISEWARPDDDGDSTFHADAPLASQVGVRNPDNGAGGLPCVQCHTTEGFVRIQVRGQRGGPEEWAQILQDSLGRGVGISCRACHGRNSAGEFSETGLNPLRFPKNVLCGRCHNDETIKFADFRDDGEIVNHPQREMLAGSAGEPVPDGGRLENTAHTLLVDACVSCHFNEHGHTDATHAFQAQLQTCVTCHGELDTFDRPAFGDYDGNGAIEGIQTEVRGLLAALTKALLDDEEMRFEDGRFEYGESSDGSMTGASVDQKRAAFNYYSVVGDASYGIHNAARTVQLLQHSYKSVTGVDVPGADLR